MTLPAQVMKGVRTFARLNVQRIYNLGNRAAFIHTSAGVPADGFLNDIAEPGALCVDTTNKTLYQNSGTKASTNWDIFTTASGTGAFTGTFDGAVGGVTPAAGAFTTIDASGAVVLTATTDASATTSAAVKTAGGLGVAKKAYVGTDLHVGGHSFASYESNITAHSGGGQGSAFALTKDFNQVKTSGADTDSVKLPVALEGMSKLVVNDDSAQDIVIFPSGSETIDGGTASAGVTLGQGERALFFCIVAGNWISTKLGVALTAA